MKKIFLLISLIVLFESCDRNYPIEKYYDYKTRFDKNFTDQFPKKIKCDYYQMTADTQPDRNNVGFYLQLHLHQKSNVKDIKLNAQKLAIAKYNSSDKCLFIVNRFETVQTYDNIEIPKVDSTKLNIECERNLLPIPNFVTYKSHNSFNDLKLDKSFEIYIFESKAGKMLKNFKMNPFSEMPEKWKNGISKGIAISEKNKDVIYWSIAW